MTSCRESAEPQTDHGRKTSLLVLNMSRGAAIALARKFGQLAIVAGVRNGAAELISCRVAPSPRGSSLMSFCDRLNL